ncbi:MAG: nitrilase-related carbon-nitrogen hydrolase [Bacillota bacterium]|nr:nitrilase-related carbon-nitrogen hydrolase [Bacillota bacterium]
MSHGEEGRGSPGSELLPVSGGAPLFRLAPGVAEAALGEAGFAGFTAGAAAGEPEAAPRPEGRASRGLVRVAAVQMELRLHRRAADWARQVRDLGLRAARRLAGLEPPARVAGLAAGPALIAFPEDVATGLVGLLPDIDALAVRAERALRGEIPAEEAPRVADVFAAVGPAAEELYTRVFAALARETGAWVAAGSANLPGGDGCVYNVAHLFAPDGRLVGRQAKAHLLPLEAAWGLVPGRELQVWELPWGRLAQPVCMDATYFETFRIARGLGADVVVIPSANPEHPYNEWTSARGIWPRVQESQVYGVQASMVGSFLGVELSGRSGIFAPLELSPGGDGVLDRLEDPYQEGVAAAVLDLRALDAYRSRHPLGARLNRAVIGQLLEAYGRLG